MYVCMYMCICVCTGAHELAYMWERRPAVHTKCLPQSLTLHELGVSLSPELASSAVCLPPQYHVYWNAMLHMAFTLQGPHA